MKRILTDNRWNPQKPLEQRVDEPINGFLETEQRYNNQLQVKDQTRNDYKLPAEIKLDSRFPYLQICAQDVALTRDHKNLALNLKDCKER